MAKNGSNLSKETSKMDARTVIYNMVNGHEVCSKCRYMWSIYDSDGCIQNFKYCPNCGVRIAEEIGPDEEGSERKSIRKNYSTTKEIIIL